METKQEILDKLKELGIDSENCYPKKSFVQGYMPVVGMFEIELKEDFYFFNSYTKRLYKFPQTENFKELFEKDVFKGKDKWLIPLDKCEIVWEDKPFEELLDQPFSTMTLRQYACIHLKVPNSGTDWLDTIIKSNKQNI